MITMAKPVIEMKGVKKSFFIGKPNELEVLHGIDLTVNEGEFVAIIGESGSGKSTLMNIIGALDKSTQGSYVLAGKDVNSASDRELSEIRNKKVGFVFQTFNLIGRQSALKNVELPMLYAGYSKKERSERAKRLLSEVGMEDRMKHRPNELSGGQKQRVAIARAMANDPSIILADEPTGALDSETSEKVMEIFKSLNREHKKTVLLITHNSELAAQCDRILTLKDGMFTDERSGKFGTV